MRFSFPAQLSLFFKLHFFLYCDLFVVRVLLIGSINSVYFLQIAYRIARDQFSGRLKELFLVLSDDEPRPVPSLTARRLSLDPVTDPRREGRDRQAGRKHHREPDSMSVESASNPKKPDQTKSGEKKKK